MITIDSVAEIKMTRVPRTDGNRKREEFVCGCVCAPLREREGGGDFSKRAAFSDGALPLTLCSLCDRTKSR